MPKMIEVIVNDRLGRKLRIKVNDTDTIWDLKRVPHSLLFILYFFLFSFFFFFS